MDKPSWIRVWEAKIPPKLKVFVWQILNRDLPTTETLIEKKVEVLPRCPVCWDGPETMEHLFLYCLVARALRDYSGLEYLGEGLPRHTFHLFLKRLLALLHQLSVVMAVVAILWTIWRSRNRVVFEGKQFVIPALMRQFNQQYEEWVGLLADQAPRVQIPMMQSTTQVGNSHLVCMWNGATKGGSHSAGGMVLFDPARTLLLARGVKFSQMDDPVVVELLVLREAIIWCMEQGLSEVRFEDDAKVITDKINQADTRDSRLGAVLEEIGHYFRTRPGFSMRFVGRENNRVAHLVARKALSLYPTMSRFFDFQTWLVSRV
ncbi:unnamed protein product [Linum trigynum]|uniref:Reverse transcriptase zinc-binding domain-containing protein n=1 Tax=Linum trigynum TaxID=586398 RepID=A0AAV2DEU4_9ROSI